MNIRNRVIELLCESYNIEITDNNMNEEFVVLGVDSIMYVQMIIELEDEFGIEFDDDIYDTDRINSVSDLCDYVEKKVSNNADN